MFVLVLPLNEMWIIVLRISWWVYYYLIWIFDNWLFVEDQDDVNEQILSISDQLFPEEVVSMDMELIVPLI